LVRKGQSCFWENNINKAIRFQEVKLKKMNPIEIAQSFVTEFWLAFTETGNGTLRLKSEHIQKINDLVNKYQYWLQTIGINEPTKIDILPQGPGAIGNTNLMKGQAQKCYHELSRLYQKFVMDLTNAKVKITIQHMLETEPQIEIDIIVKHPGK